MEKVKNRNYKLFIEEYDLDDDYEAEYVVYSDIKPLKFYTSYEPYGGWTIERYLIAQDGKLYIVEQRWSSVYRCSRFEVQEVTTKDINVDKIGQLLEE